MSIRNVSTAVPAAPTRSSRSSRRTASTKPKPELESEDDYGQDAEQESDVDKKNKKRKAAAAATKPEAKKKKTKADTNDAAGPLAERRAITSLKKPMCIGAHVSAAGGVHNSITNAVQIGANSLAFFLKSQRKWVSPPLADDVQASFQSLAQSHGYSPAEHMLPHGSYLVNLAQPDATKAAQAYGAFVDDLHRCARLGIRLYNFHPGSAVGDGATKAGAVERIAAQLNRAHEETSGCKGVDGGVVTVLENMAGSGNVIGSRFEELRDIIALVKNKDRVGVCIDTCHAFAAGYDLRSPGAFLETMTEFDRVVGIEHLKALHLNDSKAPLGSNRDLHANIGFGFLGLQAFHNVMNYEPFAGLPMVLETPIERRRADGKKYEDHGVWAGEIKLLEGLVGSDPESEEFKATVKSLQAEGKADRDKIAAQVDKKGIKGKAVKGKGKGRDRAAEKKECASCDEDDSD